MTNPDYLLDNAAPQAGRRFTSLETLYDQVTFRHLETIGVSAGWDCLEVGAGNGSVARWLADRAGPTGGVLATDLDPRWLPTSDQPNLQVRRHDIVNEPLPQAAFDLIHERLVLIHLPQREAVVQRMAAALKPGGWLLVEDYDALAGGYCLEVRTPDDELVNKVAAAVYTMLQRRGADVTCGRRLPRLLREAGLAQVTAEGQMVMTFGGSPGAQLLAANIEQVGDEAIDQGLLSQVEIDRFLDLMQDPGLALNLSLFVSAYGQRPQR